MPHKICPGCKKSVGVRTKQCDCGYKFLARLKSKNDQKMQECDNWRLLKPGDRIKTIHNSGPIYLCNNQTEYMGHYGVFVVASIDKEGIHAYGEDGYAYIYMGKERRSITGTILKPHKIKILTR